MARYQCLVLGTSKASLVSELFLDVLLVLDHVWFSCQHALAWGVFSANINNSEDSTGTQQTASFFQHTLATILGCLVEGIPADLKQQQQFNMR